jgi:hypothetical protein
MVTRGNPALNRVHGVTVIFRRDYINSAPFKARRVDAEHMAYGQDIGLELKILMRDYYVNVSDLVVNNAKCGEPKSGDLIIEGTEAYEVQPPDEDKPAAVLQPGGLRYLIHTRRLVGFDINKFRA